jgi:uncharacterized membrane protein
MKTVYFPLAEWIFLLSASLGGESIWTFKLILLLAESATVVGLVLLTSLLRIPVRFTLLYALCPLPILQFALDAHMDALGLPLLIFGLFLYAKERRVLAYLLIGLSISIKPVALIFLPLLVVAERGIGNKLRATAIPVVILAAQFIPYLLTSHPFESLTTFTKHWTFNGAVFETLNLFIADNQRTRLVCAFGLGIALIFLWVRKKELWMNIYYSILLLLLFSPVVHPWYVGWLAVMLPVARRWSGIFFASAISLTGFTIVNFKLHGVWEQSSLVIIVEYLPVLVLMIHELTTSPAGERPA